MSDKEDKCFCWECVHKRLNKGRFTLLEVVIIISILVGSLVIFPRLMGWI